MRYGGTGHKLLPECVERGVTVDPDDVPRNLDIAICRGHDQVKILRAQPRPVGLRPDVRNKVARRHPRLLAVREHHHNVAITIGGGDDSLLLEPVPGTLRS